MVYGVLLDVLLDFLQVLVLHDLLVNAVLLAHIFKLLIRLLAFQDEEPVAVLQVIVVALVDGDEHLLPLDALGTTVLGLIILPRELE